MLRLHYYYYVIFEVLCTIYYVIFEVLCTIIYILLMM